MPTFAAPSITIVQTLTTIQQATDFNAIVPLIDCEFATILNVFDGETFALYLDCHRDDQRIVVSYHKGHRSLSYRELSGFNAEKREWTHYGRGGYAELSTMAGKKKLMARFKELDAQHMLHRIPRHMTLYRKNGDWRP
jgi:hypothetical protein